MTYSVTVSSLCLGARQRSNKERSQFVTDSEVLSYVDRAWKELYDIIVSTYQDYYMDAYQFTTTTEESYDLPTDFYKVNGVDQFITSQQYISLRSFQWAERNRFRYSLVAINFPFQTLQYHVRGNKIHFIPTPLANHTVKVWYIPRALNLTTGTPGADETDTVDCHNGWEDFIITTAAMWIAMKEESFELASALKAMKDDIQSRVTNIGVNRDALAPERTVDIAQINDGIYSGFGWNRF